MDSLAHFLSIQWPRYQTKTSESIERVWRFILRYLGLIPSTDFEIAFPILSNLSPIPQSVTRKCVCHSPLEELRKEMDRFSPILNDRRCVGLILNEDGHFRQRACILPDMKNKSRPLCLLTRASQLTQSHYTKLESIGHVLTNVLLTHQTRIRHP